VPAAWPAVPPAASRRVRGFKRNRRRLSVIARRRPAAAKSLQPPDFLQVRHQRRIGRIAHQLQADAVGLHGHDLRVPPARRVRVRQSLQHAAELDLDQRPAVGVLEQLTGLGGRHDDGLGHLVRGFGYVDGRPDLGLGHWGTVAQNVPLPLGQRLQAGDVGEQGPQLLHGLLGSEGRRPRRIRGGGDAG